MHITIPHCYYISLYKKLEKDSLSISSFLWFF
nr:MAG TPA: hypothetical protein [Caudoviricetes sp.]